MNQVVSLREFYLTGAILVISIEQPAHIDLHCCMISINVQSRILQLRILVANMNTFIFAMDN